ncbi:hypothetical protein D7Z54_34325 [Salibacterium salarium]|uniref:YwdI family protein n=1 Tax=Salibacterium salarium TaxID=284579 RepID=A0A428MRZ2_9BACI|nr:DUF5327 family protein [Salibacterium salarium]RSL28850.1 hypothetical protein D7Z54_34325 [Salibacterium salarium]
MNISARTVVDKMEEEFMQLADGIDRDEETAVKEHARVIKAYCDIMLGEEGKKTSSAQRGFTASSSENIRPSSVSTESPVISSGQKRQDIPSTEGNLLEF